MDFWEKDLEEIIFNSDLSKLRHRGLNLHGKLKRQLNIGNYGIADLVCFKRLFLEGSYIPVLKITIVELKLNNISLSAIMQAIGYARGIQDYLDKNKPEIEYFIEIIIIGKNIDKNTNLTFMPSIFRNLKFLTYKYDIDGLMFDKVENYVLENTGW